MTDYRTSPEDGPRPLHDALAEVATDLGLPDPDAMSALLTRWEELVGASIAAHAQVRSLRDGTLAITVDESPWATQLRYLEKDLVHRADELLGAGVVREVRISVIRRAAGNPSRGG